MQQDITPGSVRHVALTHATKPTGKVLFLAIFTEKAKMPVGCANWHTLICVLF